jgi:methionine-rich copper-binding protein CopC
MAKPTRTTLAGVIAVVLTATLLAGPVAPAAAHDGLLSSTPGAGETVTEAPSAVVLTFSGEILAGSPTAVVIEVTDPAGTVLSEGETAVDGVTVTQQLTPNLPAGDYTVTWRVVSSDGHPISSEFHFFVADTAGPAAAPTPSPEDTAGESTPTPTLTAEPSPSSTAAASDGYGGEVSGGGAMLPIMLVTGIVLVMGVLVVGVLRLGQKRRAQDARDAAKEPTDDA